MKDDESTQRIDLDALRAARAQASVEPVDDDPFTTDEFTALLRPSDRGVPDVDDLAVTAGIPATVAEPDLLPLAGADFDIEDETQTQTRVAMDGDAEHTYAGPPPSAFGRTDPELPAVTLPSFDNTPVDPKLAVAVDPDDVTTMGRFGAGDVRAAFAAAESNELTAVVSPAPQLAALERTETRLPEPAAELDSDELVLDIEEEESLPRFSLADDAEPIAVRASEPDIEIVSDGTRPPLPSEEVVFSALQPVRSPAKRSVVREEPPYKPPTPTQRPLVYAYLADPDEQEKPLLDARRLDALLDLYRERLGRADSPAAQATLLHKTATVFEHAKNDKHQAFASALEAFCRKPTDDDIVATLERLGRPLGRIGEASDRAKRVLPTADLEARVALLGHLVYWLERLLGRHEEAAPYVAELEKLDKAHPVALKRAAAAAFANGDVKTQRELLLRALDRTVRREERVQMHLLLAGAHAGTPEATRHYEAAVTIDPMSTVALQGLEHLGRDQEKYPQVEWALERQVEAAETSAEKVDAWLKLAELHETKFLRRERAAEALEKVLAIQPGHPAALEGLERCYHALRNWPRLASILQSRADKSLDNKLKVELLELAAEVHESKLGDPRSAVAVLTALVQIDPKNRRALTDLARLYEKLGDWPKVAEFKSRLADMAPTKRAASTQLVALGDFLNAPERDPIAAKLQYERAAAVDDGNPAAWEALQRIAALAGDRRRVIHCLEQRARSVDGPRMRAVILVELARVYKEDGDAKQAREAFESAIESDPSNEAAAAEMLDLFASEDRWQEASALSELLVNAAIRDKDDAALYTRLRFATRVAAALGDADRAMTSALGALEARPDDPGAQADLVSVASQCKDDKALLLRAKDHLVRIAAGPDILPSDVLVRLAEVQKVAGELDLARQTLERALDVEPAHAEASKALADVYLTLGDIPAACKLKVDVARNAASADQKFALLVEVADVWMKASEQEQAASMFEEARALKPTDPWLLHTLMGLYAEIDDWARLGDVLATVVEIQDTPEKKAKSLFAMAQLVRDKGRSYERAADLFDQVLDLDRRRLDAFEELVRTLTEGKDWERLEMAYRRMLERCEADDESAGDLKFALYHQLGLIYRDRLGDAARAYEALDVAARLRPDNGEVRRILTELLVVTGNLEEGVARLRDAIDRDPHEASLYAELYELFLRQHFFDKAWCAVDALACLRDLTAEQRRFHEDYPPMALSDVPGQIVEKAWPSHLLSRDLDPTLTGIFALVTPVVARMRKVQLRPEHTIGRPFTPAHSRMHDRIRTTFTDACEILGAPVPELLLGDPASPLPFVPAISPYGAVHVCVPAAEARADALVYVVGKRLAEQRRELAARSFFPAASELGGLVAGVVRILRQQPPMDPMLAQLDAQLAAAMSPQEREALRVAFLHAPSDPTQLDMRRWSRAADRSSSRVALLLAGTASAAKRSILAEPQAPTDLTPREKLGELLRFAVSDAYAELRGAIGIAVPA